ncbi:MAG: flippase [Oscillospiraceae bacterium]|nr:flippase [Oscillospiraceae bacterium]
MENKRERPVTLNFILNVLLKLSGLVCAAVSYPFAFRMIGESGMGRVAFSASVISFFAMAASLGISTYGIRECARVRDDRGRLSKTAFELLALQCVMTLAALAALALTTAAVPRMRENWRLFLIQGGMLLFCSLDTEWLFAACEDYGFLTVRSFVTRALSVALIILFVRSPDDYVLYCFFTVVPAVLGNIWNILGAGKYISRRDVSGKPDIWRHVAPSAVFFLQAVAITVYTNFDSALLGFFCGDAVVGAYDGAVKVKLVLTIFVTGLGTVLLPRFSYYLGQGRRADYKKGIGLSADFVWITAIPLTVFFLLDGGPVLELLYGHAPEGSPESLRWLILTLIPIGVTNLLGMQILTPLGRERAVMWSVTAGAAVDLAADLVLIPLLGAPGAALGTLLAELAVLAVQLVCLRGTGVRFFSLRDFGAALAVSALSAAVLPLVQLAPLGNTARVLVSAGAYFLTALALLLALKAPVLRYGLEFLRSRKGKDR